MRTRPNDVRRARRAGIVVLIATLVAGGTAACSSGSDSTGTTAGSTSPDSDVTTLAPPGATSSATSSRTTTAAPTTQQAIATTAPPTSRATTTSTTAASTTAPPTTVVVTPPDRLIRLAIVGSSQAKMLGNNLPRRTREMFDVAKGGKNGCTVFPDGRIEGHIIDADNQPTGKLLRWGFDDECKNWLRYFTDPIDEVDAEIVLVVTGGWEVYDLIYDDYTLTFGSPEFDAYYLQNLQIGIDAAKERGAKVALLEVPCLRPMRSEGYPVPPVAERRDDARTGHISDLFRQAAAADPEHVFFIENTDAWCTPEIGENREYRPDGVHVSGKGAALIMDTITPQLLQIPLTP